jgi:hypothetical protein
VSIKATDDTGSGYVVGWTHAGEWLAYTINVATAGTYMLQTRVASPGNGGTFHVEFNGVDATGSIAVPNTGDWSIFQTISTPVQLNAGVQVMRVVFDTNSDTSFVGDFNWFQLTTAAAS